MFCTFLPLLWCVKVRSHPKFSPERTKTLGQSLAIVQLLGRNLRQLRDDFDRTACEVWWNGKMQGAICVRFQDQAYRAHKGGSNSPPQRWQPRRTPDRLGLAS